MEMEVFRLANQSVIISDGRIVTIGHSGEVEAPKDADIIDGSGRFLLPGFIDTNVHASLYGGTSRPETIVKYGDRNVELITEFVQIALKHGLTTIRDSFWALLPLMEVRDRIARGETIGPRMLVAGNIVGWGGPFSITWGLTKNPGLLPFKSIGMILLRRGRERNCCI